MARVLGILMGFSSDNLPKEFIGLLDRGPWLPVRYAPPAARSTMQTALTPLDFARRARSLYADREAVVDGNLRWTYAEFFDRCDRWSGALSQLGVAQGDRVAYIAPNTHAQLEAFYAVPQLGAVLVPLNYRLLASDWAYMVNHSGSRVLCVHADYLDLVDTVRHEMPTVEHFVALEGGGKDWLDYEALLSEGSPEYIKPDIREGDLLTINYTSGTTARPKGVMITHRNAWMNAIGTLVHHHMTSAERYLWTLPMFHANGWTFVWIVTAVGGTHVCFRKVDAAAVFDNARRERSMRHSMPQGVHASRRGKAWSSSRRASSA